MDFTSEQNTENSDQTNASDKLFNVAGKFLALAELVGNQVYLAVLFQYFHFMMDIFLLMLRVL